MKTQQIKRLGNYTYYLECGDNDRPCIGYIKGELYSLIVDGGNSPGNARALLDQITKEEQERIAAVLITHWHWDHVFGADTFGVKVIGSSKLKRQLDEMSYTDWSPDGLKLRREQGKISEFSFRNQMNEIKAGGRGTIPELDQITDRAEFDLGGVTCIYEEIPSPHVDGSYVVYVPEDRVLFMGDCLWPDMEDPDNWFYDLNKVKAMCDTLENYDAEWYVDSHADPIRRETLFMWLERLIRILDNNAVCYLEAISSLPEELQNIDIGYNDVIEIAFRNHKE